VGVGAWGRGWGVEGEGGARVALWAQGSRVMCVQCACCAARAHAYTSASACAHAREHAGVHHCPTAHRAFDTRAAAGGRSPNRTATLRASLFNGAAPRCNATSRAQMRRGGAHSTQRLPRRGAPRTQGRSYPRDPSCLFGLSTSIFAAVSGAGLAILRAAIWRVASRPTVSPGPCHYYLSGSLRRWAGRDRTGDLQGANASQRTRQAMYDRTLRFLKY
jgi:hypothetical protein